MPISIVTGGQFGSEGKGKVALHLAREYGAESLIVRVGGSNSGHTAFDAGGTQHALRQLPAGGVDGNRMLIAPGSFIDVDVLFEEIERLDVSPDDLFIDPKARLITSAHKRWEHSSKLREGIGSTASGTGAALIASVARNSPLIELPSPRAFEDRRLTPFIRSSAEVLADFLDSGARVIVEGTQGFALSAIHGDWPYVTSRDTSAAGFLSEIGRGPSDVDDVVLVIRTHPIRVAGNSGSLPKESSWNDIQTKCGAVDEIMEYTTVTGTVRRIGEFDGEIVRAAIAANGPTRIVLNHVDHLDWRVRDIGLTQLAMNGVQRIEHEIGRKIELLGISEKEVIARPPSSGDAAIFSAVG